jgi:hypothetical protein
MFMANNVIQTKSLCHFASLIWGKTKFRHLAHSRFHPDFKGMMRLGNNQSTPFGLSAAEAKRNPSSPTVTRDSSGSYSGDQLW